jgi:hypothetical protein
MSKSRLATWKYQHEFPNRRPTRSIAIRAVLSVVAVGTVEGVPATAGGFDPFASPVVTLGGVLGAVVAVAVLVLVLSRSQKVIAIGPRYLICGAQIVYFGNVTAAVLDVPNGRLRLTSASGHWFVLERRRFPTNARKPDKIARNTGAKFTRVADRILAAVRRAAPGAVITQGRA